MKNIALLCTLFFCLAACGNKHEEAKLETVMPSPPVANADTKEERSLDPSPVAQKEKTMDVMLNAPPTPASVDTAKKITKDGEIRFQTADVNKTRKGIIQSVQALGGYVEQDTQTKNEGSDNKEYNLKVRIPAKNFDKLLDATSDAADKIESRNVNIKDVSAEYIDTRARIDNKKKLEQRYLQLLAKAGKMSDMLQIEEKLEDIRSDIESTQGQLNYMTKQVAYSTLDITFYSTAPIIGESTIRYKFKEAVLGGWNVLQSIFLSIVACWPILVLALVVILIVKMRRYKGKIQLQS